MARKCTLRVVLAVLLGLLAALCLLSLAPAQLVETECTPLKPKACKKSANCLSTGKKKNHRCTAAGPLGAERCIAVQKAKGKPNMRTRCGEQTAPGGRWECAKPKKKCGACGYRPTRSSSGGARAGGGADAAVDDGAGGARVAERGRGPDRPLADLPQELLEACARAVPAGDRFWFRLVCRSWAAPDR